MGKTNKIIPSKIDITVATAGTAVPVLDSGDSLYPFRHTPDFVVYNNNNTDSIYVGDSTVDDTWIPIAPASSMRFVHGTGSMGGFVDLNAEKVFDLSEIYIDADNDTNTAIVEFLRVEEV